MPTDTSQNNSREDPYEEYRWVTEALAESLAEYNTKKTNNSGSDSVLDLDLKGNK